MDKKAIIQALRDTAQSASNSAASNLSAPVDAIAWALRKAGLPIPENAVGGSDWMEKKGLTAPVQEGIPKMAGEVLGGLAPVVAVAKAPQIAAGANRMIDNAMAPTTLGKQRGVIDVDALTSKYPQMKIDLMAKDGNATLSRVVVPKEMRNTGIGTNFMNDLSRAADIDGSIVQLTPSSDFGGSKSRLIDFYKRFGFVENKGRNKDYELFEAMYRKPEQ
jgi:GNAT superfamily N-acetyltransferase